jgi:hypothetical protein
MTALPNVERELIAVLTQLSNDESFARSRTLALSLCSGYIGEVSELPDSDLTALVKAAKTAVSVGLGLVGAITSVAGIWSDSLVVALNVAGVIGVGTLTIGIMTWSMGSDTVSRIKQTAWAVAITAMVSGAAFASGRGLDAKERAAGLLTVIGGINLVFTGAVGVLAWRAVSAKATKVCPECGEEVLAAALKCKHCQFRFKDPSG